MKYTIRKEKEVLTWIKKKIASSIKPDGSGFENPEGILSEILAIIEDYPGEEK